MNTSISDMRTISCLTVYVLSFCMLLSCSGTKNQGTLDYMAVTDSVSLQTVAIDKELLMPERLFVSGNNLVVYQPKEEEGLFTVFHLPFDGKGYRTGHTGRGPDEFLRIDIRSIVPDGDGFQVADNGDMTVKSVKFDAGQVRVTDRKAHIDYNKCVGCGQCVAVCQHEGAVVKDWDSSETLNYKIAEYALAVVQGKPSFHISFITNVSPNCDCWNHNDAAIIPDLGIAASFDPVALDCACADMVKAAPVLQNNAITDIDSRSGHDHSHDHHVGDDKFHLVHPDTKWEAGVEHGEKIGLGSRAYTLVRV